MGKNKRRVCLRWLYLCEPKVKENHLRNNKIMMIFGVSFTKPLMGDGQNGENCWKFFLYV